MFFFHILSINQMNIIIYDIDYIIYVLIHFGPNFINILVI